MLLDIETGEKALMANEVSAWIQLKSQVAIPPQQPDPS